MGIYLLHKANAGISIVQLTLFNTLNAQDYDNYNLWFIVAFRCIPVWQRICET
jgi:hypothetical protein